MRRFLAVFFSTVLAAQQALAAGCTLPALTSVRPGRAQVYSYGASSPTQFSGTRDYIWSQNGFPGTAMPAGTFADYDIAGDRSPGDSSPYGFALTTNSATASGNNTLHFASVPAAVGTNYLIFDITHPTTVYPAVTGPLHFESLVTGTTGTTVTMNQNAQGSGVSSGDELYFSRALRWYQVNDPDWVVYMADRTTPAWTYCFGMTANACDASGLVPLAIWQAAVQNYIELADVAWAIASTDYNGVGTDNVGLRNGWLKAGTCSVDPGAGGTCPNADWDAPQHYTSEYDTLTANAIAGATTISVNNGNQFVNDQAIWIPNAGGSGGSDFYLYRGQIRSHTATTITLYAAIATGISTGNGVYAANIIDSQIITDWEAWLGNLKTYLHTNNFCLTANDSWEPLDETDWKVMAAIPDLNYDEDGFTSDDNTMSTPGFTDTAWLDKLQDTVGANLNFVEENTGYNGETPESIPKITYGLASALLISGANSYSAVWYENASLFEDNDPDLYWNFGAWTGPGLVGTGYAYGKDTGGAYYRTATNGSVNGIVLVNNSSTTPVTYNLGSSTYHTSFGLQYTGSLVIPPATAFILQGGSTPGVLPGIASP